MDKPAITYPRTWDFKVIGRSMQTLRQAVIEVVVGAVYTLEESNVSRGGKYCSMSLAVDVRDEAQRDRIFLALRKHRDVIMVL